MLEKTYRVYDLMKHYEDLSEIQQGLAKSFVTSFIEEVQFFYVDKEDFDSFYDESVSPAYAVESFCDLNAMIAYPFKFEMNYEDSENWHIKVCMINRVYNNLDSELE